MPGLRHRLPVRRPQLRHRRARRCRHHQPVRRLLNRGIVMSIRKLAGGVAAAVLAAAAALAIVTAAPADAAVTAGCGKAPTLTSGTRTISSGGQNRTYILRVPDNYDRNRPYQLIFAFHWLNGTAANVASAGYYGLQQLSNNSAILVAPQ